MANPVSEEGPAQKQPPKTALRGKLTRARVAERLGVSISKVRSMEGTTLHPEVIDGVHYFSADDVDFAARATPPAGRTRASLDDGQVAARVFRMIDNGKELIEIVEELEVTPELVRTLFHEWKTDLFAGEDERRRAAEDAAEQRQLQQFERDADRQSRDLDRMVRQVQGR